MDSDARPRPGTPVSPPPLPQLDIHPVPPGSAINTSPTNGYTVGTLANGTLMGGSPAYTCRPDDTPCSWDVITHVTAKARDQVSGARKLTPRSDSGAARSHCRMPPGPTLASRENCSGVTRTAPGTLPLHCTTTTSFGPGWFGMTTSNPRPSGVEPADSNRGVSTDAEVG